MCSVTAVLQTQLLYFIYKVLNLRQDLIELPRPLVLDSCISDYK